MIDLSGKVALVPGSSGGIGSAVARVLAACGADIIVGYHSNSDVAMSAKLFSHSLSAHSSSSDMHMERGERHCLL